RTGANDDVLEALQREVALVIAGLLVLGRLARRRLGSRGDHAERSEQLQEEPTLNAAKQHDKTSCQGGTHMSYRRGSSRITNDFLARPEAGPGPPVAHRFARGSGPIQPFVSFAQSFSGSFAALRSR